MKQCLLSAGILILALLGCTREPFERKSNEDVFSVRVIGPKDIVFEEEATRGTVISGNTLLCHNFRKGRGQGQRTLPQ